MYLGRNGAGKSTVFKVALGLVGTDGGEVTVFGKPVEMLTTQDRQRIGVAFADAGFSEYLTITDIAPVLAAMYPSVTEKEFLEQCSRMELPLSKKIKEFSTGMRAKLKVLIALDHEAELLILDEPTDHLDMESITALNNGLIKFPGVVLFASRDHQVVQTTANRIIEFLPDGTFIDKVSTYDEYLENDEMARKRQVYNMSSDDENDN